LHVNNTCPSIYSRRSIVNVAYNESQGASLPKTTTVLLLWVTSASLNDDSIHINMYAHNCLLSKLRREVIIISKFGHRRSQECGQKGKTKTYSTTTNNLCALQCKCNNILFCWMKNGSIWIYEFINLHTHTHTQTRQYIETHDLRFHSRAD